MATRHEQRQKMIIRQQQIQAISTSMERNFRLELAEELRDFAPWHAEMLGHDGLLVCVDFAVARARMYGFTTRGSIRLYLQTIFLIGSEFDSDPLVPWAREVLSDPTTPNETARANIFYERLCMYLEYVAGPQNQYAKAALKRADEELSMLSDLDGRDAFAIADVFPIGKSCADRFNSFIRLSVVQPSRLAANVPTSAHIHTTRSDTSVTSVSSQ